MGRVYSGLISQRSPDHRQATADAQREKADQGFEPRTQYPASRYWAAMEALFYGRCPLGNEDSLPLRLR
jgi:hypothetical protein